MRTNNYDRMVDDARRLFLDYDQKKMTEKFHLESDEDCLYIRFIGQMYQVSRKTGMVTCRDGSAEHKAGFNEAMSIYDILCSSAEKPELSGQFVTLESLNRVQGRGIQTGSMYREYAEYFDDRPEVLLRACEMLGGIPGEKGDVSCVIPVFDFFPVCVRFWESDEDFPASLQFFLDRNALDFMHFETLWYVISFLCARLKACAEKQ